VICGPSAFTVNQRRVTAGRLLLDSTGWLGAIEASSSTRRVTTGLDALSHRLVPVDGPGALLARAVPTTRSPHSTRSARPAPPPTAFASARSWLAAASRPRAGAWRPRSTVWRSAHDLARAHDLATGKHLHATVDRALETSAADRVSTLPNDQRDEAVRLLERAHELTASTKVDLWLADQLRRDGANFSRRVSHTERSAALAQLVIRTVCSPRPACVA